MRILIHHPHNGGPPVLKLKGNLTNRAANELKTELTRLIEGGYLNTVIDMTEAGQIDSAAFAVLTGYQKQSQGRGGAGLGIVCTEKIKTWFDKLQLEEVFVFGENVDDVSRTLEPAT